MKRLLHSQTSMAQLLKFGKGKVISSHNLLSLRLLIPEFPEIGMMKNLRIEYKEIFAYLIDSYEPTIDRWLKA